jgi:glycosyltransferase involved in cell wall biosynthesis
MFRTLIIIPALNEEASLPSVLESIRAQAPNFDVLVVDDGSTDRTATVARAAGARVVSLPYNMGVGGALRTGFRFAVKHDYDRVVQLDADGQHDPANLDVLIGALDDGADLAIGSRFLARDGHYDVDRTRGSAMAILRVILRALSGRDIHDTTSGFRAFSAPMVREFADNYPREFLSDTVEALLIASYSGYRVVEVPTRMRKRLAGEPSHRSLRLAFHYVRVLVVIGLTVSFQGRRHARRTKVARA